MSSSLVRVLAVSHVHPAGAGPSPPHAVELSFFDSFQVSKAPIQFLFLYDGGDDDGLPRFDSIVRSLQSSLAATLAVFLPLAGKLTYLPDSGDVVIDYSPEAVTHGVRFVEAEYDGSVDDMRRLAGDEEHDTEAFVRLVPELEVSRLPAPLLAVQVTKPRDDRVSGGAVAVGVAIHHGVADGQPVWQFIKAWAAAARGGGSPAAPSPPPTFDRSMIRHPTVDSREFARTILHKMSPALPLVSPHSKPTADVAQQRRRTFFLTAGEIQSLKQRITETRKAGGERAVSTYIAITSLAWTSIVRAKSTNATAGDDADDNDVYFVVSADCRRRLLPPADDGYFGNCIAIAIARSTAGELCNPQTGLAHAAAAIKTAIREELEGEEAVAGADRWLERLAAIPEGRLTAAGSSHRYMAYETDFGWGPPRRAELVTVYGDQLVTLLGGGGGGVVQVTVVLGGEHMDAFAADFRRQLVASSWVSSSI